MAFTANTAVKGKPTTIEVRDDGSISYASAGCTWELDSNMQPARFTREDGVSMIFTKMKDGRGLASTNFGGHPSPAMPASVENNTTLASFAPVLQAVSDVSNAPTFPQEVKAKLADGLAALGQGSSTRGIF